MNTNTLCKAIEELSKTTPDISYVRGMLETLLEVSGGTMSYSVSSSNSFFDSQKNIYPPLVKNVTTDSPEGMAVEAAIASLQGMPQPKTGILEKNITLN